MSWLRRSPLRWKLVALVLVLVAVALVVISVVTTVFLRSYLVGRVDDGLAETTQEVRARGVPVELNTRTSWLPSDFLLVWHLPGEGQQLTGVMRNQRYAEQELPPVPAGPFEALERRDEPHTVVSHDGSLQWRMAVIVFGDGTTLVVAQDMTDVTGTVNQLIAIEVLVGTAVLVLLAALGAMVVRRSLRPLVEIEATAEAIAGGDLSRRVPDLEQGPPRTEPGRLARALNAMLAQIESAFAARAASQERARRSEERMRRFVADASHELRTPLTTIRGFAELYRQTAAAPAATGTEEQAATGPDGQAAELVRRIEDEASRMGLLVEDLLLLARMDQERPLESAPVDPATVVTEAVEAARAVDPARPIALRIDEAPPAVAGDEARIRQVVSNLLRNALAHTPDGSPVSVRLGTDDRYGVIEVVDEGPGLTRDQAERIFERFYRVDTARGRPSGRSAAGSGAGLGLAIVAALVAAHRGTVEVDSAPGQGATFRVRLPRPEPQDTHSDDPAWAKGHREG